MKNLFKVLFASAFVLFASCSSEDEGPGKNGNDDNGNKDITAPDAVTKLEAFAGKERAMLKFTPSGSVDVKNTYAYWNEGADSILINIEKVDSDNKVSFIVKDLEEGEYTFEVCSFDESGNKSEPVSAKAKVYGDTFAATASEARILTGGEGFLSGLRLKWEAPIEASSGVVIEYTTKDSKKVKVYFKNEADVKILNVENCKMSEPLKYCTFYVPEVTAIDSFFTEIKSFQLENADILPADKELFVGYHLGADTPRREGEMKFLWDGLRMTTPENYDECGYGNYLTGYNNKEDHPVDKPASFTFDLGMKINVQKFRASLYWAYTNVCPQIYELYGYTGEGEPQEEAEAGEYGEPASQWGPNWVKMASIDNSGKTSADFGTGDVVTFEKNNYKVRYLRLKCTKNWKNLGGDFSLCEVDIWGYNE